MADQDIINLIREQINAQGARNDADNRLGATVTNDYIYNEFCTQRRVQGREAWLGIWREWRRVFPDVKGTVQNVFVSGNKAVVETTWDGTCRGDLVTPGGTIPATGKRMERFPVAFVYTVERGKLKESNAYFDLMTLLQQIGATPQR
jgi:steroid delta-isomerase-like uncharacterized protein